MIARRRARVLGALAILATASGCRRGVPEAGAAQMNQVPNLAPPHVPGPLASTLLAFAAEWGVPPAEVASAWRSIEAMAGRIAARPRAAGEDVVDSLLAVVFGELAFAREVERSELRFMVLPPVVADRRGSCVGLGALVLVLAERLAIPLDGVMVPGHFFVRVRAGSGLRQRNLELLRRGEAMPDAWYAARYGPWPASAAAYFRALGPGEVLAVHWFNGGNLRRASGDWAGAGAAYQRAIDELPSFAEAWASLGDMRQASGDLAGAGRAYREAARAHPELPGLARNLGVLEHERGAATIAEGAPAWDRPSAEQHHHMGDSPGGSLP
jgi:tetratricopeptide (TPR) repeat protein